jgi:hypothetical protein
MKRLNSKLRSKIIGDQYCKIKMVAERLQMQKFTHPLSSLTRMDRENGITRSSNHRHQLLELTAAEKFRTTQHINL